MRTISSKNFLAIGLSIIVVALLVVSGFLFLNSQALSDKNTTLGNQNSLLQTQVSTLKDEKVQLEKDLIFYKNTDLAKELEIVNLKLDSTEKELKETQNNLSKADDTLRKLRTDISTIPKITGILAMMMDVTYGPDCFNETDKAKVRQALTSFNDMVWLDRWDKFINDAKASQCTMSPSLFKDAIDYGIVKISELAK